MDEEIKQETVSSSQGSGSGAGSGQADVKGLVAQLEALLDEYMVKKAPFALPVGAKEFIANVSPYLIIIMAVMLLPFIVFALGLSAMLAPFAMMGAYGAGYGWGFGHLVLLVATVATFTIEIMAVPGLFKRTKGSWRLLFYASIVSVVGNILSFNIIGGIIGAIIGWYILFQMKELYKN